MNFQQALLGAPDDADHESSLRRSLSFVGEGQYVGLNYFLQVVRRHRLLLSMIIAISVLIVLILQLTATPLYQAGAAVQVEMNDATGSNQADVTARNQQRVANEARLYQSRELAKRVAIALDLVDDPEFVGAEPGSRADRLERAADRIDGMMDVSTNVANDFIDIGVRSTSPVLAARIANQFPQSLRALKAERRAHRKDEFGGDLDRESARLARGVREAEQQVANFRLAHNMLVGAGGQEDYAQLNRVAVEAISASALRSAAGARSAGVADAANSYTTAGATSPLLQQQQRQYDDLLRQRSEMGIVLGAQHPDMLRIQAQLKELGSNMAAEQEKALQAERARDEAQAAREQQLAKADASAAGARAGQLQSQVNELAAKAYANTANSVELSRLERGVEVARQAYLAAAKQAQDLEAQLENMGVNSVLVSAAAVPDSAYYPTPKKSALAAFIGSCGLGLLLVFAIEMLDRRLRTSEQLRRLFGLPTLAMLPVVGPGVVLSADDNPVIRDPHSLFAEVGRTLASEVEGMATPGEAQSVLITSPLPGDGKSTVALTLVAAAASMGRRAVVVDLDLRRGTPSILHSIQSRLNTPDLIDYMSGSVPMELLPGPDAHEVRREVISYSPVVLSTREAVGDPAMLFRRAPIRELMATLRDRFDLIVINAPAVLAVRDARTLTEIADSTIMVVRWGRTTIDHLQAAVQLLHSTADAAVFNRVDYLEHARRAYGDSIQFYVDAAACHNDFPRRNPWYKRFWGSFAGRGYA